MERGPSTISSGSDPRSNTENAKVLTPAMRFENPTGFGGTQGLETWRPQNSCPTRNSGTSVD